MDQTPTRPNPVQIAGGDTSQPINLRKRLDLLLSCRDLRGKRVLDCGCGEGEYVMALRALGVDAIGIEFQSGKVARAHEKGIPRNIVYIGDVQKLSQKANDFDALVFNEVLEHVPDDIRALKEAYRVLRAGGELFVFSPNRFYPFETHGVYRAGTTKLLPVWTPGIPYIPQAIGSRLFNYWARNYWPHELRRKVCDEGFAIVRTAYVWQTFEGIANDGSGTTNWMRPLRPFLRRCSSAMEKVPGLRVFGVSQFIHARKAN